MDVPLDEESRANRFLSAMDGFVQLLGGQVPGQPIDAEQTACIASLLADEAKILAHRMEPPRIIPAND